MRNVREANSTARPLLQTPSPVVLPGQYHQAKTGLNSNYQRDCYDPQTGRYLQSDPIDLAGGSVSTYAYAGGYSARSQASHQLEVLTRGVLAHEMDE